MLACRRATVNNSQRLPGIESIRNFAQRSAHASKLRKICYVMFSQGFRSAWEALTIADIMRDIQTGSPRFWIHLFGLDFTRLSLSSNERLHSKIFSSNWKRPKRLLQVCRFEQKWGYHQTAEYCWINSFEVRLLFRTRSFVWVTQKM